MVRRRAGCRNRGSRRKIQVKPGTNAFGSQYTTAIAVHHLRVETGQKLLVDHVSLMGEPEDRGDLERLLGCPVRAPAR